MKLLLTVVAAFLATFVVNAAYIDDFVSINSKSSRLEGRITNGTLAKPKQFPYQCGLIQYFKFGSTTCGGTLISKRWILTAAHCAIGAMGIDAFLGATNKRNHNEKGQQIIYIQKRNIYLHEQYDPTFFDNDVALLKLPVAIKFNDYVRPANLPKISTNYSTYAGIRAIASGWGRISDAVQTDTDHLRWVEVPVMNNEDCKIVYDDAVTPRHICISTFVDKKSTCNGDSGGPLVLTDGSHTLIGVTAFGKRKGCALGFPAVFTRITAYLDWIEKKSGVANR